MGYDTEARKDEKAGVYCSKTRLWLIGGCAVILFVGAILITHFVTKNSDNDAEFSWPDSWGKYLSIDRKIGLCVF